MSESIIDKIFTRSLWVASYLILKGHDFVEFKMRDAHNGHFIFKRDEHIERDISKYYSTNPEVPIRMYLEQYDALRDLVMQSKREVTRNRRRLI